MSRGTNQFASLRPCLWLLCLVGAINAPIGTRAGEPVVWSGLTFDFSRPDDASPPANPANQDRITDNVWLTRATTQGIFNIAQENAYDKGAFTAPADTEWATDLNNPGQSISAANWESLTFSSWYNAYESNPPANAVDRLAVVHLVTDNIYLDIKFTSWAQACCGGFSYIRAEPPSAGPTGDYNGDGTVDAADYTVWRDTFGQTVTSPGSGADGDESGEIDAGDYQYWKDRFGQVVSGGGAVSIAVPEPATIALILGGLLAFAARRLRITPRGPGQDG